MSAEANGHTAERAEAEHDHGHAANTPATAAHTPATAAHAPATAARASATGAKATAPGERPIANAFNKAKTGIISSASQVVTTTSAFGIWIKEVLRAGELEPVSRESLLKTPFYAVGQALDGTALNVARRTVEVAEPSISAIRAFFGSTIGTILRPIHSITHPLQTLKKPIRLATSALMIGKNAVMAAPRAVHEFADRSIARTIEQINTQVSRIPLLGQIIAKPTNWLSRKVADIIGGVKSAVDWVTSPIDHVHNAVAPA